jgi:hypothetical protein
MSFFKWVGLRNPFSAVGAEIPAVGLLLLGGSWVAKATVDQTSIGKRTSTSTFSCATRGG